MLYGLPRNRCASDAASRWMASGRNSVWTAESAGMRTARGKPCLCIREISGSPCTGLNMQTGANMRRIMRGEAAALYQDWVFKNQIEVIVPVPMYRWKKRRRGYNQAETFARALGRELGLPVDAGLVRRVRNTVPQKELNGGQRAANLKNAFQLAADIVKYKKILLVDDIYTTGTTIDTVSEVLLKGGAERIYYICVSIGAGF